MIEVDFLPESFHRERDRRRRVVRQAMLVVILTSSLGAGHLCARSRLTEFETYAAAVAERAAAAQGQIEEIELLNQKHASLVKQELLKQQLGMPYEPSEVLATISELMPRGVTVNSLSVSSPRLKMNSQRPRGGGRKRASVTTQDGPKTQSLQVWIQGVAPDDVTIAEMVQRMSAHGLFSAVRLPYSRSAVFRNVQVREFRLEAEVTWVLPSKAQFASWGSAVED